MIDHKRQPFQLYQRHPYTGLAFIRDITALFICAYAFTGLLTWYGRVPVATAKPYCGARGVKRNSVLTFLLAQSPLTLGQIYFVNSMHRYFSFHSYLFIVYTRIAHCQFVKSLNSQKCFWQFGRRSRIRQVQRLILHILLVFINVLRNHLVNIHLRLFLL